jgi:hypothetical protein
LPKNKLKIFLNATSKKKLKIFGACKALKKRYKKRYKKSKIFLSDKIFVYRQGKGAREDFV